MDREDGRFKKGNIIGAATRFADGNKLSDKYKDEYCEKMLSYFRSDAEKYPTFELFADSIGVHADTLLNWQDTHPRFRAVYAHCKAIQKGKLIRGGVLGIFNPAVVKFVAENCHGMREKVDNKVTYTFDLPPELDEEAN